MIIVDVVDVVDAVDVFNIISQKVPNTGIHLNVDEEHGRSYVTVHTIWSDGIQNAGGEAATWLCIAALCTYQLMTDDTQSWRQAPRRRRTYNLSWWQTMRRRRSAQPCIQAGSILYVPISS